MKLAAPSRPRRIRASGPTVHFLIGVPGSGKSVFAQKLRVRSPSAEIVSSDKIRERLYGSASAQGVPRMVFRIARRLVAEHLRAARDVIYDATNLERPYRKTTVRQMKKSGAARVWAYSFCVPISECLLRNQRRRRTVPEEVIIRMARQMQRWPPSREEGFDEVFVVDRLGRRRRAPDSTASLRSKRSKRFTPGAAPPKSQVPAAPGTRKHP